MVNTPPTVSPALLGNGPGFLYWAPLGTTIPDMTTTSVIGGKFTSAWVAPWVFLGPTTAGSSWSYNMTTAVQDVAELLDSVAHPVTGRATSTTFNLANYTASNIAKAWNGASLTVTGTTTTTATAITPVQPGQETRFMIGWESNSQDVRKVGFQGINTGDVKEDFGKQPAYANIPFNIMWEVPVGGIPVQTFTAGTIRA